MHLHTARDEIFTRGSTLIVLSSKPLFQVYKFLSVGLYTL